MRRKSGGAARVVILGVLALLMVFGFLATNLVYRTLSAVYSMKFPGSNIKTEEIDFTKRVNMLLIGVDAPYLADHARSDSMMIISFNPANKKVYILSIARDTWITPPWLGFPTKINAINNPDFCSDCGTARLIETIEWLTEIKIHCYMKTNFRGFAQIVDVLGGVDIDVEMDMDHEDIDGTKIHLKKGFQHLNGDKALQYVRFRSADADWQIDLEGKPAGRVARQAKFIQAIFRELLQFKNLGKIGQIIGIIQKNVETNLNVQNGIRLLLKFQELMKGTTNKNLVVLTWWGEDGNIQTGDKEFPVLSVVIPYIEKIREQCKEFLTDAPPEVKPNP
jgi:LCP family protein required for cell wall assembly